MQRTPWLFTLAALGLACALPPAGAQDWPTRPIKLITTYPAGGAADVNARALTSRLSPELGQPIVVEARPGGNSNIGASAVATAAPDGYTLLQSGPWLIINQLMETGRHWKPEELVPVARWAVSPNYLMVPASSPARTLKDYVEMAKRTPGLFYGNPGIGSTQHMAIEMFKIAAGIRLDPVQYKGTAPILPDLIAGRLGMAILPAGGIPAQLKAGTLRALASTGTRRSPETPEVPTMAEEGYPSVNALSWYGIHVPAGTPAAVIQKLSRAIGATIADPEVKAKLLAVQSEEGYLNTADFNAFVREEEAAWRKVVERIAKPK